MAKLSELRKQAKDMGINPVVVRRATTAAEMEQVIADHKAHDKPRKKSGSRPVKKSSQTTTARKKSTTRTSTARKASGRKASTPAKSRKSGTAKRSSNSNSHAGRFILEDVDYSLGADDGWNPRDGSPPDRIIKAMKRFRGNRPKVFEFLKADVWDFVDIRAKTVKDRKHDKASAYEMLKYRISRTAWDYAMRTGQHEPSSNRAEYGTAGTGEGTFVPASKRKKAGAARKASKPAARKSSTKPARKPATRQKPAQRRRGRPRAKAGSRR